MALQPFSHVILDFDGVVADTESVFALFDATLAQNVLRTINPNVAVHPHEMRRLAGNRAEKKFKAMAQQMGIEADHLIPDFLAAREKERQTLFVRYPAPIGKNLQPFLEDLKHPVALAINKQRAVLDNDLNTMGLSSAFAHIITAEPPLRSKPHPDILLKAAEAIGANPTACAYVGDNALDIQAAKAANMRAIGFVIDGIDAAPDHAKTLHEAGADAVIDDFLQLLQWMR